jgi:hypothetical protein
MRIFINIVGGALLTMGVIWILQGVNVLPGSFMTGQMIWAYRGGAVAVAGLLVLLLGYRMRR